MSRADVQRLMGDAIGYAPAEQGRRQLGPGGETWRYQTDGLLGGVALELDFEREALVRVHMHSRYLWESDRSAQVIYDLTSSERIELPEFRSVMACPQ